MSALPAARERQETLSDTLLRIMVEIALKQDDPAEREAMLEILRKDGWL